MEFEVMVQKAKEIKNDLDFLLSDENIEPCYKMNVDAALAHIHLLCIELGLDIE